MRVCDEVGAKPSRRTSERAELVLQEVQEKIARSDLEAVAGAWRENESVPAYCGRG